MRYAVLFALGCYTNAPPYAACEYQEDCAAPSTGCLELLFTRSDGTPAQGALCTVECTADADCPEDGMCLGLEGDERETYFCAQRCDASTPCYAGFRCTTIEGPAVETVCLP